MLLENSIHGSKLSSTALLLIIIHLLVILHVLLLSFLIVLSRLLPLFVMLGDSLGDLRHVDVIHSSTLLVEVISLLLFIIDGQGELLLISLVIAAELMGCLRLLAMLLSFVLL